MLARDFDSVYDAIWDFEWVGNFVGLVRDICKLDRVGVVFEINEIVISGLITANVGFGVFVVAVIFVNVEVIGLDGADNANMGGFFEIPELETTHLVDDNGVLIETV